jgi:hypothetical protein
MRARLCVDQAESLGVPMVVGSAVRQILTVPSEFDIGQSAP